MRPTKKQENAMNAFILDVWIVNGDKSLGDCNSIDLVTAIKKEKPRRSNCNSREC